MDMGGGGNSATAESRNNVQNPRDVSAEYGLADFNYPQRFSLSGIYELPVGHGKRFLGSAPRALDLLAGGWSVNSIVSAQDGPPGTLTMATATSNTGTTQYPNRICNGNLPGTISGQSIVGTTPVASRPRLTTPSETRAGTLSSRPAWWIGISPPTRISASPKNSASPTAPNSLIS